MNNAQHITMCALFLCNGFADLAVNNDDADDEDVNDNDENGTNNAQHITMCALFLCNGFADLAVSNEDDDDDFINNALSGRDPWSDSC